MEMKFSDGQSEFLRVFNFVILCCSRNSRKLDACEKLVFYSIIIPVVVTTLAVYESFVSTYSARSFARQVVDVGAEILGNEIVNLGLHDFVDRVALCVGSGALRISSPRFLAEHRKKRLN